MKSTTLKLSVLFLLSFSPLECALLHDFWENSSSLDRSCVQHEKKNLDIVLKICQVSFIWNKKEFKNIWAELQSKM